MKLAILQLSDIHLQQTRKYALNRVAALVSAICAADNEWEHLIVIFTGDIAFAGGQDEYKLALVFIDDLKSKIGLARPRATVTCLSVPGNHDCNYKLGDAPTREIILDRFLGDILMQDLSPLAHAVIVQDSYEAFANAIFSPSGDGSLNERIYRSLDIEVGEYRVRAQLINTAFACRRSANKSFTDQGKLFVPLSLLPRSTSTAGESYSIVAMHHPLSWLDSNNAMALKDILNGAADLVLFGHQHAEEFEVREGVKRDRNLWVRAGALQPETGSSSSFNLVLITLPEAEEETVEYEWQGDIFVASARRKWPRHKGVASGRRLIPISEKMRVKLNDPGTGFTHPLKKQQLRLADLFVRPELRAVLGTTKDDSDEMSLNEREILTAAALTLVLGDNRSGKTTLAKRLFEQTYDCDDHDVTPLIIEASEFNPGSLSIAKIWKVIDRAFSGQFEASAFVRYTQLDPSQRLLIIDNWQQTPLNEIGRGELIRSLSSLFGKIVLFGDETIKIEDSQSYSASFAEDGQFRVYRISPLGHLQRAQLIRKWVTLGQEKSLPAKDLHDQVVRTERIIDTVIGKSMVPSYPVFVLALLQMDQNLKTSNHANGSYGYLYESLITSALAEVAHQSADIDVFYTILGQVAWKVFQSQQTGLSVMQLTKLIRAYGDHYKAIVDPMLLTSNLVRANILSFSEGEYSFKYKYIYYFFAARFISDGLKTPATYQDMKDKMLSLTLDVSDEQNANIIIFLIYLTRNASLIEELLNKARSLYPTQKLFDANGDVAFVSPAVKQYVKNKTVTIEGTPEDNRDEERQVRDEPSITEEQVVDEEEDEASAATAFSGPKSEFAQALKLMDILGQAVRNFPGSMPGEEKVAITAEVYRLGLRIMSFVVSGMDAEAEHFKKFIAKSLRGRERIRETRPSDDDEMSKRVDQLFVAFLVVVSFGLTKAITSAIGLAQLRPTYDDVMNLLPAIASVKLVDASVSLDHGKDFPKEKILGLCEDTKDMWFARAMLRQLVAYHFAMFHVDRKTAISIGTKLGINMKSHNIIAQLANKS